jgi:imidazolonepropionase-like amidohydrolase
LLVVLNSALGAHAQERTAGAPLSPRPVVLRGATLLTAVGPPLRGADLMMVGAKIAAVGTALKVPADAEVIDAAGLFVTPGLIDTHSHIGVYAYPAVEAHSDGNEMTDPVTPHVRARDAILGADLAIPRAWKGGVTTVQVLPGSGNTIGGESAVIKLRGGHVDEMIFEGAPRGMKMAMGENPKRVYGARQKMPMTRMGSAAVMREAFAAARQFLESAALWAKGALKGAPPTADLKTRALADVLLGKIRVHVHGYLPHDFLTIFRIADEFGFSIATLQHALEAHRIAPEIRRRGIGVATFSDLWGGKHEMVNGRPDHAALLHRAGVRVAIQTDHPVIEQRYLVHEAAKAVRHGLPEDEALRAITLNPAWMLGVDARVGSLEAGKDADVVVWSEHPFAIGARALAVYIDGRRVHAAQ